MNLAIFLFVVVLTMFIFFILWYKSRPKHLSYKEEILYGVLWKWSWKKDNVVNLWCYCPKCNNALVIDDTFSKNVQNLSDKSTYFVCKNCDSGGGVIKGGDRDYALVIVKREILKNAQNLKGN